MRTESSGCTIDHLASDRVLEFAAFSWPQSGSTSADWPMNPGSVQRDSLDRAILLHFAPGRVLAPDPSAATEAVLDAATTQGAGTRIDATGKWAHYVIAGPDAARLLACTIELGSVLDKRECAAVTLFDCPAVIARTHTGFELWLQSSYGADFLATAERFRAALQRHRHSAQLHAASVPGIVCVGSTTESQRRT
jgi:hypothetical protein